MAHKHMHSKYMALHNHVTLRQQYTERRLIGQFSDERWSVTNSTGDSDAGAIMIRVIPAVGIIFRGPVQKITYI